MLASICGPGRSFRKGNGNPLRYFCLGNPMDRGAWWATVHGVHRVRHGLETQQQQKLLRCGEAGHEWEDTETVESEVRQKCPTERSFGCCLSRGFPGSSGSKASAYNAGDSGFIPGLRRSAGEGNGNPLQYSCLENPMD